MKLKLPVFVCIFLISATSLWAQKADSLYRVADSVRRTNQYKEALILYDQAMELSKEDSQRVTAIHYGIAECHYWLRENKKAESHYLTILQRLGDNHGKFSQLQFYVTTRLGYLYRYRTQEFKNALSYFKKEYEIISAFRSESSVNEVRQFRNAYNLASTFRILYDYNTALNYAFEALSIAQNQKGNNKSNLSFSYSVIANILYDLDRWDEATDYYLKKIDLNIQVNGPRDFGVGNDYNNLASNLIEIQEYEQAQEYLQKALAILNTEGTELRWLSNTYRHLGETNVAIHEYELSKVYFKKAIEVIKEPLPAQNAEAHQDLADVFERQHLYDSALLYYQKAIGALLPDFEWQTLNDNPTTEQLFNEPYNYRLLSLKAACWLHKYKQHGNKADLLNANAAFRLTDELTDAYRNNFTLESSKLFFQDWNYEHYVDALESVFELYQIDQDVTLAEQAWNLIEKNKSLLMLENLLSSERLNASNIPDSVKNAQSKASQEIWNLQRDIRECDAKADCGDNELITLRANLRDAQKRLEDSRQTIRAQFPDYYSITQDKAIMPLTQMNEHLNSKQLLINYFATDSAYFALASNGQQVAFNKMDRNAELDSMLNLFLNECSGVTLAEGDLSRSYQNFTSSSHYIFEKLLKPVLKDFEVDELIIIPDGLLALTPFEAIISKAPVSQTSSYAKLDYLINDYKIQFGYSATLWSKNSEAQDLKTDASLLALGTSGERSQRRLAKLIGTTEEASALNAMPNTTVLIGDDATEQNFKQASSSADIIHLALHNINDRNNPLNSQLIFNDASDQEDGALHLYELFSMEMNPQLVVLSACETGVSEWKKGEGPYHIGRGFLYHGNPAMILSLWKVRDKTASTIMQELYKKLYKGHNSVEALRMAKLNWLGTADELSAHPSNWAAFVGIGQVGLQSTSNYQYFLVLVVLGIIVIYIARSRRKKT